MTFHQFWARYNKRQLYALASSIASSTEILQSSNHKFFLLQQVLGLKTASKSEQSRGPLSHVAYLIYAALL